MKQCYQYWTGENMHVLLIRQYLLLTMYPRHETRHFIQMKLVRFSRTRCYHLL